MFHKRNCGSYSVLMDLFFCFGLFFLFCFFFLVICLFVFNLPVTDCTEMGTVSPLKSSISIWFGVNTFYLGEVSLIQYYVFLRLISRLCLLTYYEFGLTEYHCMSLILGIKWKIWWTFHWSMCQNNPGNIVDGHTQSLKTRIAIAVADKPEAHLWGRNV